MATSITPSSAPSYPSLSTLLQSTAPSTSSPGRPRPTLPSEENITALLQARARAELPYTQIGPSGTDYVVVNPLRMLDSMGEASRKAYQASVEDVGKGKARAADGVPTPGEEQPHIYELAGRVWMLMSRKKETQGIIYHGFTGSGKSTALQHLTTQLLALSTQSRPARRLGDQISYLLTLLSSFGDAKSQLNPSASQHGKYFELHFTSEGTVCGAKVLAFGLHKSRLGRLKQDERTFHIFYQLLAGASPEERDALDLQDPASYALLASSGCYRLPGGPFSDDSAQLGELRAAMASLGFKAKHVRSIFTVLTLILRLSNLTFVDDRQQGSLGMTSLDQRARVENREELADVAALLGVQADELEAVLVNRTKWVRRELCSMLLDADGAALQRDNLMRDLYAILFTYVVDTANRKLSPPNDAPPELQIVQLDLPGFTSRTIDDQLGGQRSTLVHASGQNGLEEFTVNYMNELVQSYVLKRTYEDDQLPVRSMIEDGLSVPRVSPSTNYPTVELLRGGLVGSIQMGTGLLGSIDQSTFALKGEEASASTSGRIVDSLSGTFGRHPCFVHDPSNSGGLTARPTHTFGVQHWAGQVSYDASEFVERNDDTLDKQLVDLLRGSADGFIAKLVSGPGLSTLGHPLDQDVTVEAQVSSMPLRTPTPIVRPQQGLRGSDAAVAWRIDTAVPQTLVAQLDATLSTMLTTLDKTRLWTVNCIRPNESGHANSFDKRRVKGQVHAMRLAELTARRQADWVADYGLEDFCIRHSLRYDDARTAVLSFADKQAWIRGQDYELGSHRIWLSWSAWKEQEDFIRSGEVRRRGSGEDTLAGTPKSEDAKMLDPADAHGANPFTGTPSGSAENLLLRREDSRGAQEYTPNSGPFVPYRDSPDLAGSAVWSDPYASKSGFDDQAGRNEKVRSSHYDPPATKDDMGFTILPQPAGRSRPRTNTALEETTRARKWWIAITWILTWWVPSFMLKYVGRMKRPDVRQAWREKLAICELIALMCGIVIFYIIFFGRLLCPDSDKAWNPTELSTHQGTDDYYAAIRGSVYDFTDFYKGQHSDIQAYTTSSSIMLEFAGQDLTGYFPPPMTLACPGLVSNDNLELQNANFTPIVAYAVHKSGKAQTISGTKLDDSNWYNDRLQPDLRQYYKGSFVYDKQYIQQEADGSSRQWAIYNKQVFDLSDYLYTVQYYSGSSGTDLPKYDFLDDDLSTLFQTNAGQDITAAMQKVLNGMSADAQKDTLNCLNNAFFVGRVDFRKEARCLVQNYLLLAFSIILVSVIAAKFLAALQLGSKRKPEMLDKFVLCQVPCYTEGEESLRKTIDSLAALNYPNNRKLIFVICDGNIVGNGNTKATPRIVLDILGCSPDLDHEPLMFKSIGEGGMQLNYGKVFSGLYEYEGNVVPYIVIVKVGRPSEINKPGNRGKRDSQVLLMQYLNRVHFDAPMNPLELEIYHQMRNVIGVEPAMYEYIFQVDADTTVTEDSLNRLIACAADDQKIIGICGETKVANERESWTTMIQVYEYYISHHLTKAFESLFGSVTCLPGCFSVYRIRTADQGRPVIISSLVIDEYAEPNVDTLHKKNLFSLGEDRYLTTLMMKHFPTFKMKFTPDAVAHTVAPSRWNVLLSQRRRWINSTIHNLVELLFLPEMCGFCFFSMRIIVFIDLLGTIILPATCAYLIYLIIVVSTGKAALPIISLVMIAAVYGLQAIIFILKREFMLIGWMIVYILAFPVFSVFLPIYSFWSMDDFSWGNTRQVVGEGSQKTVIYEDDEPFTDELIPLQTYKEYESKTWETGSNPSEEKEKPGSIYSGITSASRSRPRTQLGVPRRGMANSNRATSFYSTGAGGGLGGSPGALPLPSGTDFYRDSSPLGPSHSSRNLRDQASAASLRPQGSFLNPANDPRASAQRMTSMGSMYGAGSIMGGGLGGPFLQPNMTGQSHPLMPPPPHPQPHNPFDSPVSYFPHQPLPRMPSMPGMGMGLGNGEWGGSSYSLAAMPAMVPLGSSPLGPGAGRGMPPPLVPAQTGVGSAASPAHGQAPAQATPKEYGPAPTGSLNPVPRDEEVVDVLRQYLLSRDLMTLTKRQAREALFGLFPNAKLQERAGWVNGEIDRLKKEIL